MIERRDGRLLLSGSITFSDALEWREAVLQELDRDGLILDLAGIHEADSAALSLLLEWRREAGARGYALRYANLPQAIRSLAEVYGVVGLIPVADPPPASPGQ
jgi:phospholipid transport system transporter-binding protein